MLEYSEHTVEEGTLCDGSSSLIDLALGILFISVLS